MRTDPDAGPSSILIPRSSRTRVVVSTEKSFTAIRMYSKAQLLGPELAGAEINSRTESPNPIARERPEAADAISVPNSRP